jgi:tRNA pseudouridine38-40 synthase
MRYALGVEYDGSGFFGWQTQRQEPTVQATLEQALSRVANHPVTVVCAGRTDTGVHAWCQVVHFDTEAERSDRSWVLGANANLPGTVCVRWIRRVDPEFHARFTAFARSYRYVILNRWIRPAIDAGRVCWQRKPLDEQAMETAARPLLGEQDFSSFRSAGCKANHPVRTIHELRVRRHGDRVILSVTANAFLYHMVRNLAGTLMEVGTGERDPAWVAKVLAARDRTRAGVTAPAAGLYFHGVRYPEEYGLPSTPPAFPDTAAS